MQINVLQPQAEGVEMLRRRLAQIQDDAGEPNSWNLDVMPACSHTVPFTLPALSHIVLGHPTCCPSRMHLCAPNFCMTCLVYMHTSTCDKPPAHSTAALRAYAHLYMCGYFL